MAVAKGRALFENMKQPALRGDNPITQPGDDLLDRNVAAKSFAEQIEELDLREGAVVGVLGPWGSGKTSFINLARPFLEQAKTTIIDFNPWMFSGSDQLVEAFFAELSSEFKVRDLGGLGKNIEEFGDALSGMGWIPIFGSWAERARATATAFGRAVQRRKGGAGNQRNRLFQAMANLDRRIVVVLDDIDRLSNSEIRDVFRLVRLTASFPNLLYLLAFDRRRVEAALSEDTVSGRAYLEKILQIMVDLPAIPQAVLDTQTLSALDSALSGIDNAGNFDQNAWPDVYFEIVRPLIKNMRDVRRYVASVRGTIRALQGQIELVDVLALEAVRVFLPDIFGHLHRAVAGLTTTADFGFQGQEPLQLKAQVESIIQADQKHADIARSLIAHLFLAAQRHIGGSQFGAEWSPSWLKARRVAQEDILRLYLERVANAGLRAFGDAEHAWSLLNNSGALATFLQGIDPERLQDVVSRLELYESDYRPEHIVPGVVTLLNVLPSIPKRKRGMFDLEPTIVVSRVVLRLVRSLKDPGAIEKVVREILPKVSSLSSKLELIDTVGHRNGVGHKLVSETAAAECESAWRDEVGAAQQGTLLLEWDLLRVLYIATSETDPKRRLEINCDPQLTLALLRAARTEIQSQSIGSRAVRRKAILQWDVLVSIYGDEARLRSCIEGVKATCPGGDAELLALVDKYLTGWRHDRHFVATDD